MLFIDNKYSRWYYSIIKQAQLRTSSGYTEKHHIIPKSLGGLDTKDNLIDLTAREHFICHWLLTKMNIGEARGKMIYALNGMKRSNDIQNRYETKITSRVYEHLKEEFVKVHSAAMKGRVAPNKGKPSPRKGIPLTDEHRAKLCTPRTEETKARMRKPKSAQHIANMCKPKSPESNKQRSISMQGKNTAPKPRVTCPHCGKVGAISGMKQWHFDKCKQLNTVS